MDGTVTSKPQTLVSSLFLPCKFHHHLRKEFLGCGAHHLGSPSLLLSSRSIRRRRKSGFRPKYLLNNNINNNSALDENSILAAAAAVAAAFATLQLIYINYVRWKQRMSPKLVDDQKPNIIFSSELWKKDEDTLEHGAVGSHSLSIDNLCINPLVRDNEFVGSDENMFYEKAPVSDARNSKQLESQKIVLAWQETSINEVQPGCRLSDSIDGELLKTNVFTSLTSMMANEVKAAEGESAVNMPNLLSEKEESIAVSSCSTISADMESDKINQNYFELGHIETRHTEILTVSNDVYVMEPAKEVYNYNGEQQASVRSPPSLRHLSTKPGEETFLDNTLYHNHLKTAPGSQDVLAEDSPLTAEAQYLIGCLKDSPVRNEQELIKVHAPTEEFGRTLMHKSRLAKDINSPTAFLRTYNRLLRDGRLRDCIDLLERIERKGLLDMDKVHHTKFLNTCKSKKSVKEAFQFCKLIPKPTLSTFNMLLSICASSQDFDGAFHAMLLVKEVGLKPDCKLYTTLISTCAKTGKVDAMFEVFHEMVNAGVEPNVVTYGALIDGCARAGQVAKAFGAYGIMRSKKVQADRVIFNALITACGQSGAVDRAFDVLAEMRAEPKPIDPDHVTVGALLKTCTQAGQVDRVGEVYKMLHKYNIRGTPDVYTIAVNSCSQTGDLEFALSIYSDMQNNGVVPDEMFLSTLINVAGRAEKIDTAFEILRDARNKGIRLGNVSYSSLMGACCNAKNWQKALELYEEIKAIKLLPTVSTLNALVTSLCGGDQLNKAVEVLDNMKETGVKPNIVTYSILIVACEKKGEAELGFTLLSKAKTDGILPNLIMCRCLTGLCLRSVLEAYSLGSTIVTFNSGKPQMDSKWTSLAIMVYRETISAGVIPTIEVFSQVLGSLQFPRDSSLRNKFIENSGIEIDASRCTNICSLLDGFGEYDTRCFSVLEEAMSLGVIPRVSFKDNPIVVDARKLPIHTIEVYLLTILKGLKHRLAAGARLPNISILLPLEKTHIESSNEERKAINIAGRVGQAAGSLLRRLGLRYTGDESHGKIRINGLALRRWFKPKLSASSVSGRSREMTPVQTRLSKGISDQQRNIRSTNNLSLE